MTIESLRDSAQIAARYVAVYRVEEVQSVIDHAVHVALPLGVDPQTLLERWAREAGLS